MAAVAAVAAVVASGLACGDECDASSLLQTQDWPFWRYKNELFTWQKNMPNFFLKTMAYFEGNGWYHSKKRRFVAMGKSHQVLLAGWFFFSGVSGAPSLRIIGSIIG